MRGCSVAASAALTRGPPRPGGELPTACTPLDSFPEHRRGRRESAQNGKSPRQVCETLPAAV
eukprot:8167718-Alexandrium_andersonii.AAC.1